MKKILLILAAALTLGSCMHFIRTGTVSGEKDIALHVDDLEGAQFYGGMSACENCWPDPDTNRLYVTGLKGHVYLLDGESVETLTIHKQIRPGGYALGIDRGPDGKIYVAIAPGLTDNEWKTRGGYVVRFDTDLESMEILTEMYPAINGLAFDGDGHCYVASSNFNFLFPEGTIYRFTVYPDGRVSKPETLIDSMGMANGLSADPASGRMLYTDTLETAGFLQEGTGNEGGSLEVIYRKTSMTEAFDDLCTDSRGRIWMTDPNRRTIKRYDPLTDTLVRYRIDGFGQASSCRIRRENGEEVLYITELKSPVKGKENPYNGRGVLRVPIRGLEAAAIEAAAETARRHPG